MIINNCYLDFLTPLRFKTASVNSFTDVSFAYNSSGILISKDSSIELMSSMYDIESPPKSLIQWSSSPILTIGRYKSFCKEITYFFNDWFDIFFFITIEVLDFFLFIKGNESAFFDL